MVDVTGAQGFAAWLVEQLSEGGEELSAELQQYVDEGDRLMKLSLAANTIDSYQAKFASFDRWCTSVGASSLPARPVTLATYVIRLAKLGTTSNDPAQGEPDIDPAGRLRSSTVAAVVSAIGSVHRNNGFVGEDDPSTHPRVRKLLGAYARTYHHVRRQAHAFTLEELGLMCDRCLLPSKVRSREILLIALATHPLIGLNGLKLSRLTWDMVVLPDPDEPTMPARFDFAGRIGTVWIPPAVGDPDICPVARLRAWHAETGGEGPVFESPKKPGHPTSRAGLVSRVGELVTAAGVQPSANVGEFARLTPAERRTVIALSTAPDDLQMRDRALMAIMWWMGQRAEVIERLDVGDLVLDADEKTLVVYVGRSKNDQYGAGARVTLRAQGSYVGCPVNALTMWIERYALMHGIEAAGGTASERTRSRLQQLVDLKVPLFPALNRGESVSRLGYHGINDVAKKYAGLAGVTGSLNEGLSSHGFRAGNTTTMIQNGASPEEIAKHQLRKGTQHIYTYYRPGEDLETNPTNKLTARDRRRRDGRHREGEADGRADARSTPGTDEEP